MQHINLYLPEFRPKREWLTATQSVFVLMVFMGGMAAFHFQLRQGGQLARAQTVVTQQKEVEKKKRVAELKAKPKVSEKAQLQIQVNELRAAITNRQSIINVIASSDLGNKTGFSQHLFSLGEQRLEDLVVNRLVLTRGAKDVELEGVTRNPSAVPLYVHKLQQSSAFAKSKFGVLSIHQNGDSAQFRLGGNDGVAVKDASPKNGSEMN